MVPNSGFITNHYLIANTNRIDFFSHWFDIEGQYKASGTMIILCNSFLLISLALRMLFINISILFEFPLIRALMEVQWCLHQLQHKLQQLRLVQQYREKRISHRLVCRTGISITASNVRFEIFYNYVFF